ncbi:MAG TPA: glycosyltransferase family 9 protein [Fimbriimonadaceae bacterium]|nr:glycosyltransferase family 9 protein [Fimbriimonadaceae bacterium]HRJ97400.1 glycosyltransferase family 9 protein [Fimbriimonadaceae bacterium]
MSAPRILIVRFSAIGDCVMTAWAVSDLRRAHPDAVIVWAAETRCLPVISTDRLVDRTVEVPRERWKRERRFLAPLRLFASLRRERFDVGFDFQGHSKTALCLRLARPRVRLAARATDVFARSLNPVARLPVGEVHEVELARRLVSAWQPGILQPEDALPILPSLTETPAFREDGPIVSIQTGAGAADKIVPPAHWAEVADQLLAAGMRVCAIGGPNDPRVEHPGVADLVGKIDLREAMAVVARSVLHLAGDTGTGHIAAAYGVSTVSVFGPTPPERYRPWSKKAVVLRAASRRVEDVDPDEIVAAALEVARVRVG